jgi:hypothetical protein
MISNHLIVLFVHSSSFTEICICGVTTPFLHTTKWLNSKFIAYLQVRSTDTEWWQPSVDFRGINELVVLNKELSDLYV